MARNDVETFLKKSIFGHFEVILRSFWVIVRPEWLTPTVGPRWPPYVLRQPFKMAPYTPLWAPKNVSNLSLGTKITDKTACSDLGALLLGMRHSCHWRWSGPGWLTSILGHFGSFWVILGHFGSFWVILGSFWGHSGVILGSFTARNSLK